MKKLLLSLAAIALASAAVQAAEPTTVVYDFLTAAKTGDKQYGSINSGATGPYFTDKTYEKDGTMLVLKGTPGFAIANATSGSQYGLQLAKGSTNSSITFSAPGNEVTAIMIETFMDREFASFSFDATAVTGYNYIWSGNADSVKATISTTSYSAISIAKITITFAPKGGDVEDSDVLPTFPEEVTFTSDALDGEIKFEGLFSRIQQYGGTLGSDKDAVSVTVNIPKGWDKVYFVDLYNTDLGDEFGTDYSSESRKARLFNNDWPKASQYAGYFKEGNVLRIPVDANPHEYWIYFGVEDRIYIADHVELSVPTKKVAAPVEPVFPAEGLVFKTAEGKITFNEIDEFGQTVNIEIETENDFALITVEVPATFNTIFYMAQDSNFAEPLYAPRKVNKYTESWPTVEDLLRYEWNCVEGTEIKVPVDGETHVYNIFPGIDNKVYVDSDHMVNLSVTAKGSTSGVEAVEAAEGEAEYFNLQGVKVANPEKGLYIKVLNGKATRILIK